MKKERILIEDQMAPIGLDEKKPAFSWLLTAEEGEQNLSRAQPDRCAQPEKILCGTAEKWKPAYQQGLVMKEKHCSPVPNMR